jgi:hypothetical protein
VVKTLRWMQKRLVTYLYIFASGTIIKLLRARRQSDGCGYERTTG